MSSEPEKLDWRDEAECSKQLADKLNPGYDPAFSEDYRQRNYVKNTMCSVCPVRRQCLEYALETWQVFGVWGGADQDALRDMQCIDSEGKTKRSPKRGFRCLYCKSRLISTLEKRRNEALLECQDCQLTWWTKRSGQLPRLKKEKSDPDSEPVE